MDLLEGALRCMGGKVNACMDERLYHKRKYKVKKKSDFVTGETSYFRNICKRDFRNSTWESYLTCMRDLCRTENINFNGSVFE